MPWGPINNSKCAMAIAPIPNGSLPSLVSLTKLRDDYIPQRGAKAITGHRGLGGTSLSLSLSVCVCVCVNGKKKLTLWVQFFFPPLFKKN